MELRIEKSQLQGEVTIPASKSHTIRALIIASLAEGTSTIRRPLYSGDTASAVAACQSLGATIEQGVDWTVQGTGGIIPPPSDVIDIGNSGTTLYLALAAAALGPGYAVFTGDEQIRQRPVQPLLEALQGLGAEAFSTRGNGLPPVVIRGPLQGGSVALHCPTSQYLSSLLLNGPLAAGDTEIQVLSLNERPYVQMTLDWLDRQGIHFVADGLEHFQIPGGQAYTPFDQAVPGDFSSATFFLCAAAITGSDLTLQGLDMNDSQGDKAVVEILEAMGAQVEAGSAGLRLRGGALQGGEFDLNATPDALPALAVVGCCAAGETRLVNVPQARLKETDRIAVMCDVLTRMGAQVEELPDGLILRPSRLQGAFLPGFGDHRVVMALAVAGLVAEGETVIDTAEAVEITFPDFVDLMQQVGGKMEWRKP